VSALFLFVIATANIVVLISVYRVFRTVKRGGRFIEEDLDLMLAKRGFLSRIFRRLFRIIERSWHMYPLGLLFGLGFDTATEVGLLGISATQAAQGMSAWTILAFPALFTAGRVDSLRLNSLHESLDLHPAYLDHETANPVLAPLTVPPCSHRYRGHGRLPRTDGR
jgi:HoxN/HupN/NixA family high-affinity nickel-transporter